MPVQLYEPDLAVLIVADEFEVSDGFISHAHTTLEPSMSAEL
jgi:hypothetical protein